MKPLLKRRLAAGALLVIGVLVLVQRQTGTRFDLLVLPLLGVVFLVWSLLARIWGLLIPGCVLLGLGVGVVGQRWINHGGRIDEAIFFLSFAAGWGLLMALSKSAFNKTVWWPIFPGATMLVLGVERLVGAEVESVLRWTYTVWPWLLIAGGVALFLLPPRRK